MGEKRRGMAPKRPLENPPPASSDDETDDEIASEEQVEEQHEEEEEEEDEEEEEEESPAKKLAATPQPSQPEEESGSSTDSDETLPSPNASDFTIKPIASKPKDDSAKPEKVAAAPRTPTSAKKSKRPAETPLSPETSKKKKASVSAGGGGAEDAKKGAFQRLWSDEDEIAILEGMIEFQSQKETDPLTDMAGLHEFIKDSVHFDASKNQLSEKIRRLRRKYRNNAKRGQNGKDPVFSKPHDHKSFQLSKTIWGAVEANGAVADGVAEKINKKKTKKDVKLSGNVEEEESFEQLLSAKVHANADEFWSAYPSLKKSIELMPENLRDISKNTLGSIRRSKAKELDEKWKKLNMEEFELYVTRSKLLLDMYQALGFRGDY